MTIWVFNGICRDDDGACCRSRTASEPDFLAGGHHPMSTLGQSARGRKRTALFWVRK
jgi:hypothetical protein